MTSLGLAFICRNETDSLRKMLASVADLRLDQLCAGWNGDSPETLAILEEFHCEIHRFAWPDDFATARNFIYEKCFCDYVMYLDCDEELQNVAALRKCVDSGQAFGCLFLPLDYYAGSIVYWKPRVTRRGAYTWQGTLHEEIVPRQDVAPAGPDACLDAAIVKHHWEPSPGRIERNVRISRQTYEDEPTPKAAYNYGLSTYEAGDPLTAWSPLLRAATAEALDPAFRMNAYRMITAYCITRKKLRALKKFGRRMIRLGPAKPDGYFRLATAHYLAGRLDLASALLVAGFSKDFLVDGMAIPYEEYSLFPARMYASVLEQRGDIIRALQVVEHTLATYPEDRWLIDSRDRLRLAVLAMHMEAARRGKPSVDDCTEDVPMSTIAGD